MVALLALGLSRSLSSAYALRSVGTSSCQFFGFFVFQVCFTEGIQRTTSGNAAFMFCLLPVFVLLLNRFYGFDSINRAVVVGIACSIAGISLIVLGAGRKSALPEIICWGFAHLGVAGWLRVLHGFFEGIVGALFDLSGDGVFDAYYHGVAARRAQSTCAVWNGQLCLRRHGERFLLRCFRSLSR